jgi:hypothetical protein
MDVSCSHCFGEFTVKTLGEVFVVLAELVDGSVDFFGGGPKALTI